MLKRFINPSKIVDGAKDVINRSLQIALFYQATCHVVTQMSMNIVVFDAKASFIGDVQRKEHHRHLPHKLDFAFERN